jgi:hypothetical protein
LADALAGRLWSRTTIYVYRALAQLAGLREADVRRLVRVSFAKVAEYQKRGAVHFHAIIRLDAATDCGCPACVAPHQAGSPPSSSSGPFGRPPPPWPCPARRSTRTKP